MKNTSKVLGLAAIIAAIALSALVMTGCPEPEPEGPTVASIAITTPPAKTTYIIGESFDSTGLVVTATYDDDSTEVVTGYTLSGFDSTTAGEKTITVTYEGKTVTFTVTVVEPTPFTTPPALSLAADNAKLTYTWAASIPAADSYDVYWKAGNGLAAAEVKTGTKIPGASSGGEITGLTNDTAYSVLVIANKAGYTSIDSEVKTATPADVVLYVITGSGTSFTAKKGGATVGTAGQPIQTVIDAIKTDAAGKAVNIQFGDGTAVLDIGSAAARFENTGGNWGAVIVSGKITSTVTASSGGTLYIASGVSVTSTADITNNSNYSINNAGTVTITGGTITTSSGKAVYNSSSGTVNISGGTLNTTGAFGDAIYNYGTGTVNISGGTVQATGSYNYVVNNNSGGTVTISGGTVSTGTSTSNRAVNNNSTGTVTISGGTVQAAMYGVYNNSTGTVNITGGTVSTPTGYAVYIYSTGKVTVSGTAKITSANTNATQGTIYLRDNGTATAERLEITGGTVENTAADGWAIYNNSTGAVNIAASGVTITGKTQLVKP
ncbi:MAG: bacterial Ig-like domain-containing protein [Treponema sp.]|jgi:hypothetical protein|nr:bacterial Ig-like domain-containing protein [Treponema sp.]